MNNLEGKRLIGLAIMFGLALITRLIPHPPSFTGVSAFLITGIFLIKRPVLIAALTVGVFFISDLILNNLIWAAYFEGFTLFSSMFIYALIAYCFIALILHFLVKRRLTGFFIAVIISAVSFFLISNFGVWAMNITYPMTTEGLIACYMAGIPYIGLDIISTLLFSAIFYSIFIGVTESRWAWKLKKA